MDELELAFGGVAGQGRALRGREVSVRELVELTLTRIARLDPRLNAFTRVLGDLALRDAEAAQARIDAGDPSPLVGIPVAVKDEFDVAGAVTSWGTGAHRTPAAKDAETTRLLREAGAVIVGKTTLPELAQWGHMTDTIAWGVTRNPWDLERSPGGSSGGSAAAVAAGLVPVAVGSDGGASIRVPAAMCGLFGLKPQRGRVSQAPLPDGWHGLSARGGLARTVADGAELLDAIAGGAEAGTFAAAAAVDPPRLRVAVSARPVIRAVRLDRRLRRAVEETAELLRSLGHEVRDADPSYPFGLDLGLPRYTAGIAADARRLDHPERLERRTRRMARAGRVLGGRALRRSFRREAAVTAQLNSFFEHHDVLLTPVVAHLAPRADRWHDRGALTTFLAMSPYITYTAIWNYTGNPAAAVPAGFADDGLPVAVQLVARPCEERTIISLAAQIERARPWADRRPAFGAVRSDR